MTEYTVRDLLDEAGPFLNRDNLATDQERLDLAPFTV